MREEREIWRKRGGKVKAGELIFIHSKPGRTPGSPAWIDTLPRVHSPDRAHPLLLPVKIIPLSFLFPFYFFLKFTCLSMLVKTEGFSLGRGTRVKDGEIQKLQWALLKLSKQTEPVSAASDISWTYSLDLVDSLKPAGSPPVRFLRMCSSAWDAKESDGSRRNCESVTAEMKVLALCRRRKSFARCRLLWMCFKDLQT